MQIGSVANAISHLLFPLSGFTLPTGVPYILVFLHAKRMLDPTGISASVASLQAINARIPA